MVIVCLGDSLTEGDYGIFGKSGIANVQKENYPYFLSEMTGAEVRNYGKCGYRASNYLQFYEEGNVDLSGADLIVIMLGTNGGHSMEADTLDNQAYRTLVQACQADAPRAKLLLCTPPHVTSDPSFSNCGYAERVETAVHFVRKFAEERGLALLDVAQCPSFTAETERVMQPNDGLHFGREGYRILASYIAEGIQAKFGKLS